MSHLPLLSIVVCTYNRGEYIGKTLEHLLQQTIDPADYEVVIINNCSTDQTEKICRDFLKNNAGAPFRYVVEKKQGLSHARNRGIHESRGQIISFIDDDAFVMPDFGENMRIFFQKHADVQAIGGKILPLYQGTPPTWMSHFLLPLVSALDMGNQPKPFTGRKFPVGANMAFRREVFDHYGLFNVALGRIGSGLLGGEEKEMIYRLKKNDEPVYYVPNVVVKHVIPEKRLQMKYIRGLAEGVGISEKKRLESASFIQKLNRVFDELIKIGGTLLLLIWYLLKGQSAKGTMLVKFRIWVLKGFFKR